MTTPTVHSKFWMGTDYDTFSQKFVPGSAEHRRLLMAIQRGLTAFVRIVTGRDIPVKFSTGKNSYTDGKTIVISTDINPHNVDSQVGLVLHESAHCLLSNRSIEFLPKLKPNFFKLVKHTRISDNMSRLGVTLDQGAQFLHLMMNYLEDRRIDLWMYENASGYRPYYDAMYNKYWHSESISDALRSDDYKVPMVQNYEMFIINMTNDAFDENALPGLDTIRKVANLSRSFLFSMGDDDLGWDRWSGMSGVDPNNYPKLLDTAIKIMDIVFENSTGYELSKNELDMHSGNGDIDENNLDFSDSPDVNSVRDSMDRMRNFLTDHASKETMALNNPSLAKQMNVMDTTNAEIKNAEVDESGTVFSVPVIIYKKVTPTTVQDHDFPFYSGRTNLDLLNAVETGFRLGQVLANRISVIQDESPITYTRQTHGRIDRRMIAALGHDRDDVFSHTQIERKNPVDVWIDIDFSGSMIGERVNNAMCIATTIAQAAHLNRSMNCIIAIRDGDNDVRAAILYDSRVDDIKKLRRVIPFIKVQSSTPETLAFAGMQEYIMSSLRSPKKYFINISDGEPSHSVYRPNGSVWSYSGKNAIEHAHKIHAQFKCGGIEMMNYFIGEHGFSTFQAMYGSSAHKIDAKDVSTIARTLNKFIVE